MGACKKTGRLKNIFEYFYARFEEEQTLMEKYDT